LRGFAIVIEARRRRGLRPGPAGRVGPVCLANRLSYNT